MPCTYHLTCDICDLLKVNKMTYVTVATWPNQQNNENYLSKFCENEIIFLTICYLPCLKNGKSFPNLTNICLLTKLSSQKLKQPRTVLKSIEQSEIHLEHFSVVALVYVTRLPSTYVRLLFKNKLSVSLLLFVKILSYFFNKHSYRFSPKQKINH